MTVQSGVCIMSVQALPVLLASAATVSTVVS